MNFPPRFIFFAIAAALALGLTFLSVQIRDLGARAAARYAGALAVVCIFFSAMQQIDDHARAVDVTKAVLALAAAGCVFYERHREAVRRPVAERWKRFAGVVLGLAAITAYFDGFTFVYARYYHRWDQYHYYMGARYFRELGYDGLYRCSVVAQDELGTVTAPPPDRDFVHERGPVDMAKEVRHPDKKIRDLGGTNLLVPAVSALDDPGRCKARFSPERWEQYKADVRFFRMGSEKQFWQDMQTDHGFNPPPVWTIAGSFFASMHQAGDVLDVPLAGRVIWLQVLALFDPVFLAGMFVALAWAFGWRVFAVAAVFWGCQASAPALWTLGAFLRQDWLFWLVLAACLARKKWYALAGAGMVYAGLLRVFPGLTAIGWLCVAGFHLVRRGTLSQPMWRMLGGGVLAAAVLIPLSVKVTGPDAYRDFYRHTLQVHDRTPLTNHMGLRVLLSQKVPFEIPALGVGTGKESGRMKYTKDTTGNALDPFELWKSMRNDRYDRLRPVAWGLVALALGAFAFVMRRVRSLWIAQCLAQVFIVLMAQLTCYYYAFMILLAPLTRARRGLEAPLFGLAVVTQAISIFFFWTDDKYWMLTLASLLGCFYALCLFTSRADRAKLAGVLGGGTAGKRGAT